MNKNSGIEATTSAQAMERFELRWVGKKAAEIAATTPPKSELIFDEKRSHLPQKNKNLIIEGENLEVLKILQTDYAEQVQLIYIDPPYNTGKDFVYSDKFNQEQGLDAPTDRHSEWLSFMYSRLLAAKFFLKKTGLIAIHIDEHEVHHLRMICEEIFDESNFLGTVIWNKLNPKGDAKAIAYQHESILLFAKNKTELLAVSKLKREKANASKILKKASNLFKKINESDLEKVNEDFRKWIRTQPFSGGEKAYNKIDKNGRVFRGVSMAWPNKRKAPDQYFIPLIHPETGKACPIPERGWRNPPATMKELAEKDLLLFGKDENKQPERKYFLDEHLYENIPSIIEFGGSDDKLLREWELGFDNPKPYKFIMQFIKPFLSKDDLVMDFFAGSGSTGHAVFELNKNDGGNRNFILIQLPETTHAKSASRKAGFEKISDITIERNRRVAKEIEGVGFKVFRQKEK